MPDEQQQAIDSLVQGARIKGETRVTFDRMLPVDVTPQMAETVLGNLDAYRQRRGLKWKEIAAMAGVESREISAMRNGHHVARWQVHTIDLDRWLEDAIKQENAPKPTEFVKTQIAEEVMTVAEIAVILKCIGLVSGPSGIGKTLAAQAVAAEKRAAYASIQTAATSPLSVLAAIGRSLGLHNTADDSQRVLTGRLEELLIAQPRLIIVDEIHKIATGKQDAALHVLRDLFDSTGVPMLWIGTTDLLAYLDRRQAAGQEPLSQIRRRIGIARDLTERTRGGGDGGGQPLFSVDEIRRVFAKSKMRLSPDAVRYLWSLANLPDSGGLGICKNLVVMATKVNEIGGGDVLTAEMLRQAHGLLASRRDLGTLTARMNVQNAPPVRAAQAG